MVLFIVSLSFYEISCNVVADDFINFCIILEMFCRSHFRRLLICYLWIVTFKILNLGYIVYAEDILKHVVLNVEIG